MQMLQTDLWQIPFSQNSQETDEKIEPSVVHSFPLGTQEMNESFESLRQNILATRMMDQLRNKSVLKGKMVYGHVYNHQDHTHIHGHVHYPTADNCQLDLDPNPTTVSEPKLDLGALQDFEPQLVTICCDKEHKSGARPPGPAHHLHKCLTDELDLMNSCFDFDFCDNVSCNDFVCDDYMHQTAPVAVPQPGCPLLGDFKVETSKSAHDSFVLDPSKNELRCIQCDDKPLESQSHKRAIEETKDIMPLLYKKLRKNECHWSSCYMPLEPLAFQQHITAHLSPSELDCKWENCDFQAWNFESLLNHVNESHVVMDSLQNQPKLENLDFKPSELLQPNTEDVKPSEPSENVIRCEWTGCDQVFKNTADLTDHITQNHIGSGKSNYVCCWKGCDRKGRIFSQRQKIIRHLHVHTKHKPFKCDICGHCFSVEAMLEQHKRVHSGEKPFVCEFCGKRLTTSSSLSIHIRVHTGEKPLVCKYPGCGKRFSESSNLAKHMRTHEKKFKCTLCTKSFGKASQLQNHMSKHKIV